MHARFRTTPSSVGHHSQVAPTGPVSMSQQPAAMSPNHNATLRRRRNQHPPASSSTKNWIWSHGSLPVSMKSITRPATHPGSRHSVQEQQLLRLLRPPFVASVAVQEQQLLRLLRPPSFACVAASNRLIAMTAQQRPARPNLQVGQLICLLAHLVCPPQCPVPPAAPALAPAARMMYGCEASSGSVESACERVYHL